MPRGIDSVSNKLKTEKRANRGKAGHALVNIGHVAPSWLLLNLHILRVESVGLVAQVIERWVAPTVGGLARCRLHACTDRPRLTLSAL